jgi:predicted Fe-Mo cluster-binding NifX family protein
MKVCIPIQEEKGLESVAYGHFGSAPFFMICDLEKNEIKIINNGDQHHEHGMCQPLKAIGGEAVDAVLAGGIGAGALMKLNDMGIRVYRAVGDTVSKNIELLKADKLELFSANNTCSHHGCGH